MIGEDKSCLWISDIGYSGVLIMVRRGLVAKVTQLSCLNSKMTAKWCILLSNF